MALRREILKEGSAPRSESEIYMIAGGNHSIMFAFSKRLPYAAFFGYFLGGQESNITALSLLAEKYTILSEKI
ncbi:MAG: hypothetical protein IKA16_03290 [Oscillospiraceae bacterium]|nr:hypothetical protein [Oscillospiraceae bacterium]